MIILNETDNTATLVKQIIEKKIPLDKFLSIISLGVPITIPLMPDRTIGFLSSEDETIFIVEQLPRMEKLNFAFSSSRVYIYDVYMPYVYYFIACGNNPVSINTVNCVFAQERISSKESQVGQFCMPNLNENGYIGTMCLGGVNVDNNQHLHACVNDLLIKIASSNYNQDYFFVAEGDKSILKVFEKWPEICDQLTDKMKKVAKIKYWIEDQNDISKYLLAWEHLSSEISLKEFVKGLDLRKTTSYGEILKIFEGNFVSI